MPTVDPVEIPNRSLFRQPEVCEIGKVQPYVLRSWEAEFADLAKNLKDPTFDFLNTDPRYLDLLARVDPARYVQLTAPAAAPSQTQ